MPQQGGEKAADGLIKEVTEASRGVRFSRKGSLKGMDFDEESPSINVEAMTSRGTIQGLSLNL
jgi:hypothetical protein